MSLLTTGLVKAGFSLIDKLFTSDEEKSAAKRKLLELEQQGELAKIAAASAVVKAEAKSEHWLTSTWRPITMLVFVFIIANNYILYPYLSLFLEQAPKLALPPDLWDLLKIGLGGYVVGRSGEKVVREYKKKSPETTKSQGSNNDFPDMTG